MKIIKSVNCHRAFALTKPLYRALKRKDFEKKAPFPNRIPPPPNNHRLQNKTVLLVLLLHSVV